MSDKVFHNFINSVLELDDGEHLSRVRDILSLPLGDEVDLIEYCSSSDDMYVRLLAKKMISMEKNEPEIYFKEVRSNQQSIPLGFFQAVEISGKNVCNYYVARHRMFNIFSDRYKADNGLEIKENDKTAFIILNYLAPNKTGSHIKFVFGIVEALLKLYESVEIHVTMETRSRSEFATNYEENLQARFVDYFNSADKSRINVIVWQEKGTALERSFASYIDTKNVALTLFGLGIFESNLLRAICFSRTYVMEFQFSILNIGAPYTHGALTFQDSKDDTYVKHNIPTETLAVPLNVNLQLIEKRLGERSPETSRSLSLVTVLGSGRIAEWLESNDHPEFTNSILQMIESTCTTWTLVGIDMTRLLQLNNTLINKLVDAEKISATEFVEDLPEFYSNYDLFLQLPGTAGGGFGALASIFSGVPVLTLSEADISSYLSPHYVCQSIPEYLEWLRQYIDHGGKDLLELSLSQAKDISERNSSDALAFKIKKLQNVTVDLTND